MSVVLGVPRDAAALQGGDVAPQSANAAAQLRDRSLQGGDVAPKDANVAAQLRDMRLPCKVAMSTPKVPTSLPNFAICGYLARGRCRPPKVPMSLPNFAREAVNSSMLAVFPANWQ